MIPVGPIILGRVGAIWIGEQLGTFCENGGDVRVHFFCEGSTGKWTLSLFCKLPPNEIVADPGAVCSPLRVVFTDMGAAFCCLGTVTVTVTE